MYKRTGQFLRMMRLKLRSHTGRLRKYYGDKKVKKNKKIIKEYLILWKGFPVEEGTWIIPEQLITLELLQQFLREDNPVEEKL